MEYPNIRVGIFLARPNRFIAQVEINGVIENCHVKNTGRCRELLIPGTTVYVQEHDRSQAENEIFFDWGEEKESG